MLSARQWKHLPLWTSESFTSPALQALQVSYVTVVSVCFFGSVGSLSSSKVSQIRATCSGC